MKHKKAFGIALAFAACLGVAAPSFSPIAEAAMKLESSEHWIRVEFDALPQTAAEVAPLKWERAT